MRRLVWPVVAIVAVFLLGVVVALVVGDHVEQRAIVRTQARTSAAMSITLFLVVVILLMVLVVGGGAVGWLWWKGYRRREKLREAVAQAQVYALLNGARLPAGGGAGRPSTPVQAGGNTFVFPGGQMASGMGEQSDALAGLLPSEGWEVVG